MFGSFRYATRQVRKSPGFAVTAIVTLALGIGATTAVFSVLDAVLLQPLPFPEPDRLVALASVPDEAVSIPTVEDWQRRTHSFVSIAAYRGWAPTVRSSRGIEAGNVLEVSQPFFATLGATFALGQDFPRTGNERDCTGQAIVSGGFWRRLGGGTTLGMRTLEIDRRTFQITGVLPVSETIEGRAGLNQPEIFLPTGCDPWQRPTNRGSAGYWSIGRLRPGVSLAQAEADLARAHATLLKDYPNDYSSASMQRAPLIMPWVSKLTGADTRPALMLTLGACGLLLLIACANLASLLLARNVRRRHEFATRATLGAGFGHLLRQLLVESSLLAVCGSAAGIAIAYGSLRLLLQVRALQLPRLAHASISPAVLAFATGVTLLVTILLTLLPALRTLRPELLRDLAVSSRSSASGSLRRAGRALVTAQIAFALVLVAGAGWMVATVHTLLHQPLGFQPDHLLMAGVDVDGTSVTPRYDAARTTLFFEQTVERLRHLPGVQAVAATNHPPLGHAINRYDFCSDLHPEHWNRPSTIHPDSYHVTPGYFGTVGQTLLAGREFSSGDNGEHHVAIVNRALAAREWPGESALGHRVRTGDIEDWATVVGVVEDVHSFDLDSSPGPDLYLPLADHPQTGMTLILRTSGEPAALARPVRDVIRSEHADLALYNLGTMEHEMTREVALRRFLMQVASAFGGIALLLATLGTYGLLAYEVSLREKEIGIRLALGSSREAILGLLLRQESRWVLLGASVGLVAAALTGFALRARLYHAAEASLPVLGASMVLLLIPALVAIVLPARRAAQVNPVEMLRSE